VRVSRGLAVALAVAALAIAACSGTSETAATTSPSSPSASSSASAPPSPPASPAQMFKLNGVNGAIASGTIALTHTPDTMTVELQITGLAANSSHVSHVHTGTCSKQGGIVFALNQVIADGTGAADTRTMLQAKYPPASGHWYVVVHAGPDMQGANATYLLCGNLF
jgi:hypothetical protein